MTVSHTLSTMRSPQVTEQLTETDLVVVPTASIEQHGPHLPLAVDTLRAEVLGQRIADELDCVLAPVIRPGVSDHHMAFPGTISLREETFRAIVRDYVQSLAAHGFTEIALFTSHGGNTDALDAEVTSANDELDANVFVAGDRDGMMTARTRAMNQFDVTAAEAGAHAGAAETAFILETHSELVDRSAAEKGFLGDLENVDIESGLETVTDNGILGDATKATPEQGADLIDSCVTYLVTEITDQRR